MEKLRVAPRSEPLTDTWTSDFLSREGKGREVVGERLRDKTVPWQVQRRLMQAMTNSFPSGAHFHRMGLRRSNEWTLCQRAWKQREDDRHQGCGRSDPETLGHIQSARCALQARAVTWAHHHCWQQVHREIAATSPESKGWTFLTLEGEQSMQTFRKQTGQELNRRTTLTEAQTRETTDQVLDDAMWRCRPDGFAVNEKEHIIHVLEFKRVSDAGQEYVAETQQFAEAQHLVTTQDLQKLYQDTQWTVEKLLDVVGHKSVSVSICHDLLLMFSIRKEGRVKVIKNLGRTLLDEL